MRRLTNFLIDISWTVHNILSRLICMIVGHKPHRRIRWTNEYRINMKRKGKKKTGHGVKMHKCRHYREYCSRCGKLLRKK